jgi:hypothetical protein
VDVKRLLSQIDREQLHFMNSFCLPRVPKTIGLGARGVHSIR